MNQDRYAGIRKQLGDFAKQHWSRITGVAPTQTTDQDDLLAGRIHKRLALSEQESQRQFEEFMTRNRNWSNLSRH